MKKLLLALLLLPALAYAGSNTLLNVSYDSTRAFYQAYNTAFAAWWKHGHGQNVHIRQSHGGSMVQARNVIDGLPADVVTLALAYDIDAIAAKNDAIPKDWQKKLPHDSTPFYSTVVFLVRDGNPMHIHDWDDLVRPGVSVIMPNPKTSGGARWDYLAAWAYATSRVSDESNAGDFMRRLFKNVPVLDTGARAATTTFAQRRIGDVLVTWENEAHLAMQTTGRDKYEIILPSVSVRAETPVAVMEGTAKKNGTLAVAQAYLEHLYSPEAQELAATFFYRPSDPDVLARHPEFPNIPMKTVADFGGWEAVQKEHFADSGIFDQIYGK